ncbi:MAG: avidin/streptavidin family protein [Kiloniellales bacterium]
MLRTCLFAGALTIASLVQSWPAAAQQLTADATYTWVNELGSTMTTTWGADGLITGTYVTAVGCGAGTVRPLTGWWNKGAMTFTVNWQECNSLTSWTGNYASGKIATLWLLALSGPPEWNSINAGADTFTLQ